MKKIIFIGLILLVFSSCKKKEIYNNAGYTIGKVTFSTSVMSVVTYHYEYKVENNNYIGKKGGGVGNSDSRMIGRCFLVVYNKSSPKKSDMNFKYPIDTEQDFIDMLNDFKTNPPKP